MRVSLFFSFVALALALPAAEPIAAPNANALPAPVPQKGSYPIALYDHLNSILTRIQVAVVAAVVTAEVEATVEVEETAQVEETVEAEAVVLAMEAIVEAVAVPAMEAIAEVVAVLTMERVAQIMAVVQITAVVPTMELGARTMELPEIPTAAIGVTMEAFVVNAPIITESVVIAQVVLAQPTTTATAPTTAAAGNQPTDQTPDTAQVVVHTTTSIPTTAIAQAIADLAISVMLATEAIAVTVDTVEVVLTKVHEDQLAGMVLVMLQAMAQEVVNTGVVHEDQLAGMDEAMLQATDHDMDTVDLQTGVAQVGLQAMDQTILLMDLEDQLAGMDQVGLQVTDLEDLTVGINQAMLQDMVSISAQVGDQVGFRSLFQTPWISFQFQFPLAPISKTTTIITTMLPTKSLLLLRSLKIMMSWTRMKMRKMMMMTMRKRPMTIKLPYHRSRRLQGLWQLLQLQ
jgi:hypothetical protein